MTKLACYPQVCFQQVSRVLWFLVVFPLFFAFVCLSLPLPLLPSSHDKDGKRSKSCRASTLIWNAPNLLSEDCLTLNSDNASMLPKLSLQNSLATCGPVFMSWFYLPFCFPPCSCFVPSFFSFFYSPLSLLSAFPFHTSPMTTLACYPNLTLFLFCLLCFSWLSILRSYLLVLHLHLSPLCVGLCLLLFCCTFERLVCTI